MLRAVRSLCTGSPNAEEVPRPQPELPGALHPQEGSFGADEHTASMIPENLCCQWHFFPQRFMIQHFDLRLGTGAKNRATCSDAFRGLKCVLHMQSAALGNGLELGIVF